MKKEKRNNELTRISTNIKKRLRTGIQTLNPITHTLLSILCSIILILGITSCADILNSPVEKNADNTGNALTINISSTETGSRTLFPDATFVKYRVEFWSAGSKLDQVILDNGDDSVTISGFPAGNYTIKVYGIVNINGALYDAAYGEETIEVDDGFNEFVDIFISASQSGDPGFFSYYVSFPNDKDIYQAYLLISEYGTGNSSWVDLFWTHSNTISCPAGYYFMEITISNGYQTARRREIVHIYSNMETIANYTFDEDDFIDTITISGTIDVKINSNRAEYVTIEIFSDPDYEEHIGGDWWINHIYNDSWSIRVAPYNEEIPLYFYLSARLSGNDSWVSKRLGQMGTVHDTNVSGIPIVEDFNTIMLSGSADVRVDGQIPDYASVRVVNANGRMYGSTGINKWNNNQWSLMLETFSEPTDVWFEVDYNYNGRWGVYWLGTSRELYFTDMDNINLGTINISTLRPQIILLELDGWDRPGNEDWTRWTNELAYNGLFDNNKIEEGDVYKFDYTFTSNIDFGPFDMCIIESYYGATDWVWNSLSNWSTVIHSVQEGTVYSGTIYFVGSRDSGTANFNNNKLAFYATDRSLEYRPILQFSQFEFSKIGTLTEEPSIETWVATGIPEDLVFEIDNPGTRSVAQELTTYQGKSDVIHIKPGIAGYSGYVTYHDLSIYAGQTITITIATDVWLNKTSKISWEMNSEVPFYPVVCGSKDNLLAGSQWHTLWGRFTADIPVNADPDNDRGQVLFLSGAQLGDAEVYFANFEIKIETGRVEDSGVSIVFSGIAQESVDLTLSQINNLRLGDSLNITVTGDWDSYLWLLNGTIMDAWGNDATYTFTIPDDAEELVGKRNRITVFVTKDEVPYSKELWFYVVR